MSVRYGEEATPAWYGEQFGTARTDVKK